MSTRDDVQQLQTDAGRAKAAAFVAEALAEEAAMSPDTPAMTDERVTAMLWRANNACSYADYHQVVHDLRQLATAWRAERAEAQQLGAERAPLDDAALDAIRARNQRLAAVPFDTHDGSSLHGIACVPCELVRGVGDVTWLLAALHDARAQLRTETAITKALLADKEELAMRAHHAEVNRDRLTDELAEERAGHDPLLRCIIVKAAPDRDLYIGWSNVVEAPTGMWTRTEALAYGFPRSRLDRADRTGTSSMVPGSGQWDDIGFIAEQRGWLRRGRIADYAQALAADNNEAAWDLLEPLEGETEVRRG